MPPESSVQYLLGLYRAIFVDIARIRPHLRVDSERDYSRLLSIVEKVGIRYFLIDLPAMGKHLDLCLSQRLLTKSGLPFSRPFRSRGVIPRHYKGLYLSVFDESGELRVNPDIQAIKFLRQLFGAAKRFRISCSDSSTWEHVNEFFQVDRECRQGSLEWDSDDISFGAVGDLHLGDHHAPLLSCTDLFQVDAEPTSSPEFAALDAVQRTADICSALLGGFAPTDWESRHGPGAVADQRSGTDKYRFQHWPAKLEKVFPFSDHGFHNHAEWADWISRQDGMSLFRLEHEPPSRLIAVPKTLSGPRLIASEPASHQWCQQMIRDFLATSVSRLPIRSSVNFRSQSLNGVLALEASHSESHATIDLSMASDRLSCWVIERVFRRNISLLEALHACRTRYIRNEIDRKSPKFHKLRKFTTMGSAVTFPVQTYVFCFIAIGAYLYTRGIRPSIKSIRRASQEVRVFGDDIIVPTDCWPITQELLSHLGLKVNPTKTFGTGKFRESCGVDAYDGNDVTKISVLTHPDVSRPGSIASSVDVHNNLLVGGYYAAAEFVKSTVDSLGRYALPIVAVGSGAFGWYSKLGSEFGHLNRRWNPSLHRVEILVTAVRTSARRDQSEGRSMLLQYFTEVKRPPISHEERLGTASILATKLSRRWEALSSFV